MVKKYNMPEDDEDSYSNEYSVSPLTESLYALSAFILPFVVVGCLIWFAY